MFPGAFRFSAPASLGSRPEIDIRPSWAGAQTATYSAFGDGDLRKMLLLILMIADTIVIVFAALIAHWMRDGFIPPSEGIVATVLLAAGMHTNAIQVAGGYRWPDNARSLGQAGLEARTWSVVFILMVALGTFTRVADSYSRIWAILYYALALLGLIVVRKSVARLALSWQRHGLLARTVAVVDLSNDGAAFVRRIQSQAPAEIRLLGVFQLERGERGASDITDLIALSRLFRIDEIIVATHGGDNGRLDPVVRLLGQIPTNVRICPEIGGFVGYRRVFDVVFGEPMLRVHRRPLDGRGRLAKRIMDVVLGTLLLLVLSPIMLAVACAVKLSSRGPVLFKQKRLGFNNDVISVWKFRSMEHRPTSDLEVDQVRRNDPRVTLVGRFIRRYSLDELPQLFNVLLGEMSLVGPRPHALVHNEQYATQIDDYLARHRVQPGITGSAQINGYRGETDTLDKMEKRILYDLAYIENWSLWLDLKILLLTPVYGVFNHNAF